MIKGTLKWWAIVELKFEMNGRKMKLFVNREAPEREWAVLGLLASWNFTICRISRCMDLTFWSFMLNSFEEIRKGELCREFLISETWYSFFILSILFSFAFTSYVSIVKYIIASFSKKKKKYLLMNPFLIFIELKFYENITKIQHWIRHWSSNLSTKLCPTTNMQPFSVIAQYKFETTFRVSRK